MRAYHGTTKRRAERIRQVGFVPRRSRVWFTTNIRYAKRRAKTQARRTRDRPVTLRCDLDLGKLRTRYGSRRVIVQSHLIVIRGRVPASMLLETSGDPVLPFVYSAEHLAAWINRILGLKPHKGVSKRHPGVQRLELWIRNRLAEKPGTRFEPGQLLVLARQWIPEHLNRFKIDPDTLKAVRLPEQKVEGEDDWAEWEIVEPSEPDEERILDALTSTRAEQRAKGLRMLTEVEAEEDLFEWCAMFLDDASVDVRVAAIETARHCDDAEVEMIADLVDDDEKRIRAAAIAFMTRHGEDRASWFQMALTDPETHVRVETAKHLEEMDPAVHRRLFELALYDPNPKVAEVAEKMTAGKGYAAVW